MPVLHDPVVSNQRERPWEAPARSLALYCPDEEWRFAVLNDAGIIDGRLVDLAPNVDPQEAQAALLRMVERDTGLEYVADWKQDKPRWWGADLAVKSD